MSLNKPLVQITRADLEALLADSICESKAIDYKRGLNLIPQEAKDEFCRDVSSFANTIGGDIIYGIDDKGTGIPKKITGFPIPTEEGIKLQLSQILERHVR